MNYFELFELPVSILIDQQLLTKKYFALQKKYHPDFFTHATEIEQETMLEMSSQVNKAYKTFQHRDETIRYVLQLKNLLEEEEKFQLPADFLMEVMELNETLSAGSRGQVHELETTIYAEVKDAIEQYNDTTITTAQLLKIKEYYFKKKYLQRILDRMAD